MSDKQYNGWTNYETWNVNLWIDNDGSEAMWRERAEELIDDNDGDADGLVGDLAREVKASIEENGPELQGCYADLLGAALGSVNWYEIAKHYVDDAKQAWDEEHKAEEYAD